MGERSGKMFPRRVPQLPGGYPGVRRPRRRRGAGVFPRGPGRAFGRGDAVRLPVLGLKSWSGFRATLHVRAERVEVQALLLCQQTWRQPRSPCAEQGRRCRRRDACTAPKQEQTRALRWSGSGPDRPSRFLNRGQMASRLSPPHRTLHRAGLTGYLQLRGWQTRRGARNDARKRFPCRHFAWSGRGATSRRLLFMAAGIRALVGVALR